MGNFENLVIPMVINEKYLSYLEIWKRKFTNHKVKAAECMNVSHVFEILLIATFRNAKVERMFLRMARIKTD